MYPEIALSVKEEVESDVRKNKTTSIAATFIYKALWRAYIVPVLP
jgi:hypothetical protein